MTILPEPLEILDVKMTLGECPLWDHRSSEMLWIDIEKAHFWRRKPKHDPQCFDLPERPGSFALTERHGTYLGAFENGFALFDPESGLFERASENVPGADNLRMNDGRTDRTGQFWAGSMKETAGPHLGNLWRYDRCGKATIKLSGIRIPNSLCWSLDGRTMYFADSPENTIWKYDFDPEAGPVGEPHVFAKTVSGVHPDGSCIDAEDHLWNAQWGSGEIIRYRPDGSIEHRLKLPVSQPSCVSFCGNGLDQLMITTARVGLSINDLQKQKFAGAIFVYDCDIKGVEENILIQK